MKRLAVGGWRLARSAGMLVALVAMLASCGRPPAPQSISSRTSTRAGEPMRVALLPLVAADGVGRSAHVLDDALIAALRTSGRHEVVPVALERARLLLPPASIEASAISTQDLLRLRDQLRVDAVVLGRVEQFQAFDPVAVGLTVHLVSVEDGAVLWSATAQLDAGRQDVQKDLRWWYDHANGGGNATISGWRLAISSPSLFSRYVADRLVETVVPPVEK